MHADSNGSTSCFRQLFHDVAHSRRRFRVAVVQSVHRAFSILRALASGPLGVTEVSDRVGLPKSAVARLLAALEEEGAVRQEHAGWRYSLDDGILDLAAEISGDRTLVAVARPHLLDLVDSIGETSGIGVRDGREIYYADHVEVDSQVQVRNWTGEYAPLHLVPSGLVVLSHFSEGALDHYLMGDLATTSPKSVSDPSEIRARLSKVRRDGCVWGFEEFAEGLNSVAAPVYGKTGEVAATLHVHGPAYRFPKEDEKNALESRLIEMCRELGRHLV